VLDSKTHSRVKHPLAKALLLMGTLVLSAPAFAQDKQEITSAGKTTPTEGLSLNIGGIGDSVFDPDFGQRSGLLDMPGASVGSTLFKLDISDPNCLAGVTQCLRRDEQVDIGTAKKITSVSEKGLDLSLTPRASVRFSNENSSALVGAMVEIGEDLREGSNFKNNTWYVFAGADAEALTYSPNSMDRLTSGQFHLQDRIIVGDAQAGVGYRIGDADVSLSYMRREATAEDFRFSEDAAALSFTWKR